MTLKIKKHLAIRNHKKNLNKPKYIVIHDVGALGQAMSNALYFHSVNRGASAHYFVDPKEIVQVVKDTDAAYHVGDGHISGNYTSQNIKSKSGITNLNSIGIEMCLYPRVNSYAQSYIEDATVKKTIELTKYLMKKYNIPAKNVVRHYDASGKNCPGRWRKDNWAKWHQFKNDIQDLPAKEVNKPASDTYVVKKGDTLWGISKEYNISVDTLKEINNLKDNTIYPGDNIKLSNENKSTYKVKKGDTLWAIAQKYKTSVESIKSLNKLDTDVLSIGQALHIDSNRNVVEAPEKVKKEKVVKTKFKLPSVTYYVKKPMFKGNGVRTVQKALASIYFYPEKGAKNDGVDGFYGENTADAVKRFQSMHGLKPDGIYGKNTKSKLDSLVNK